MGRCFHLGARLPGLGIGGAGGKFSLGGRGVPAAAEDPLAAHVAAMQGIDGAGGYFLADPDHYAYSLSQAGVFSDAFGGPRTYTAPYIMASPEPVQDPTSGLWYVRTDGATNTAVGNAAETVMAYMALWRAKPPRTSWGGYAQPLASYTDFGPDYLDANSNVWAQPPIAVRVNGVSLGAPYVVDDVDSWMVMYVRPHPWGNDVMQLACMVNSFFLPMHQAALRTWPTVPSDSIVQQTGVEMARFFAPLLTTNP